RFRFAPKNHLKGAFEFRRADFAGDFDFAQLLAAGPKDFASLGLHVGFRRVDATFELGNFALEKVHALDGLVNFVDQALFFERMKVDLANKTRHFDTSSRHRVTGMQVGALLGPRNSLEPRGQFHGLKVELGNLIDLLQGLPGFGLDLFLGKFLVVKLDDFLDRAGAVAQILADLEKLL